MGRTFQIDLMSHCLSEIQHMAVCGGNASWRMNLFSCLTWIPTVWQHKHKETYNSTGRANWGNNDVLLNQRESALTWCCFMSIFSTPILLVYCWLHIFPYCNDKKKKKSNWKRNSLTDTINFLERFDNIRIDCGFFQW